MKELKERSALRAALGLLVFLIVVPSAAQTAESPRYVRLTILHTNDVHGHFEPFNYGSDMNVGGVARRATLISRIRAEHPGSVLVMEAGDVFTRGPLAEVYYGRPDFAALNAVPYDIMTIGNNEFKGVGGIEGQRIMRQRLKEAAFPVVCANVVEKSTGKTLVPPYRILDAGGIRVGVFGLLTPRVAEYPQAEGLEILDPVKTARTVVDELKGRADVIVALTHLGYEMDVPLAKAVPEIDAIVGGDSHTWLEQPVLVKSGPDSAFWVGGPVIVQDGEFGKCLGDLDLYLRRSGDHDYQVMSYRGRLIPVTKDVPERSDVEKTVEPYVKPYMKPVGTLAKDMPEQEFRNWVADLMRAAVGADVGLLPAGTAGGGLGAGTVRLLDVYNAIVYKDRVVKLTLTGEQLLNAYREMGSQGTPGTSGIEAAEDGGMKVGGADLDPRKTYTVATEDFLAANVKSVKGAPSGQPGETLQDLVIQALKISH